MNLSQVANSTNVDLNRLKQIKQTIPSVTIKIPKLPSRTKKVKDIELEKMNTEYLQEKKEGIILLVKKTERSKKTSFGELDNTLRASGFIGR